MIAIVSGPLSENFFTDEMPEEAVKSNVMEVSVSEISGKLKRLVEDTFGRVRVRGEITGYRGPHSSGHMYFALKDERARLEAVIWKGVAERLKHQPEEGLEVIASGKLTTYPGSSKYQIVIDAIEPAGAGALMALLEERKKKLTAEGLFGEERKQLLPYMPKRIGVVTSPTGAVIRDVLHRISDRFPLHVMVWPVRVQGETSGAEVTAAVEGFNNLDKNSPIPAPNLIIIARGGGSIEDLWGFNDEALVRAVADSNIPIISAVGHETDWTLVDLAADVRAPTPTGAAEMAVPVQQDLEAHIATLKARLDAGLTRALDQARSDLRAASRGLPAKDTLFANYWRSFDELTNRLSVSLTSAVQAKRIEFANLVGRINPNLLRPLTEQKKQQLVFLNRRMQAGRKNMLEIKVSSLENAWRLMQSFSYTNTLERGFVVVRDETAKVITQANKMAADGSYELEFSDGKFAISGRKELESNKSARKTTKKKNPSGSQGDLF